MKYKGIIFDMNGTMVDDMAFHQLAWYNVFVKDLKAPLTQDQVKHELYGTHDEMFTRVFGKDKFTKEQIQEISNRKEQNYRIEFLSSLKLIDGLDVFLKQCIRLKIPLAIGTAAPVENVDFVLDNLHLRDYFKVIVGPEHVKASKPNPEVFLKAAELINVSPAECLVFEDSPKGIEAARRAGIHAVGVTSYHTADELKQENVIATINDYNDPLLVKLFR